MTKVHRILLLWCPLSARVSPWWCRVCRVTMTMVTSVVITVTVVTTRNMARVGRGTVFTATGGEAARGYGVLHANTLRM